MILRRWAGMDEIETAVGFWPPYARSENERNGHSSSFVELAAFVGQPPHPTVMDLLQLKNGLHSSIRINNTRATLAQKTCRTQRGYWVVPIKSDNAPGNGVYLQGYEGWNLLRKRARSLLKNLAH